MFHICANFPSCSARFALPGPEERSITSSTAPMISETNPTRAVNQIPLPPPVHNLLKVGPVGNKEPIIEEPATPEPEHTEGSESDIEDACYDDPDEIPTIKLNIEEFTANLQHYMQGNMELQEGDLSKALVALNPDAASIPTPKLKNVSRLRTEHYVYELPDKHPLLKQMEMREPDDPSPYLLAIWTPGETANSIQPPEQSCGSQEPGRLCNEKTCFACNSVREANTETVRGTILIPCRTAMRGSFPLNGTYFQVNEVILFRLLLTLILRSLRILDVYKINLLLPHRSLQIMIQASIQSTFQGNGFGIYQDELYTLEHLYHQYSKDFQPREFSTAFGKV
ncbi:transcriptional activator DEMETER-like isoform X1 [Gossypium australe]|uniref:Transcriptional activator DEMETER-like isoform X1 n=1 Tax=Gossypium australe TaxID=47621 RepID=A0A5B6VBT2_9ROSI|nr:transcriptional activator DEMETER-like isoform X1 [Gossypium australe]